MIGAPWDDPNVPVRESLMRRFQTGVKASVSPTPEVGAKLTPWDGLRAMSPKTGILFGAHALHGLLRNVVWGI